MTTSWQLLLLMVVSYHIVNSQSLSANGTCPDRGLLGKLDRNLQKMLDRLEQMSQNLAGRLGKQSFFSNAPTVNVGTTTPASQFWSTLKLVTAF